MTCPCGEKDYVAHTNQSFVDCLLYHRREVIRAIREFLFGDANVILMESISKSEEANANDRNWLYQHSARCPAILQLFLDRNPSYWCFIPVPIDRSVRPGTRAPPQPLPPPTEQTALAVIRMTRRNDALALRLSNNVPRPIVDYEFRHEHFVEQRLFFKYGKDYDLINVHNLQFHHAAIVAVLPDDSSNVVKKFVESLFITHGECRLNKDGRLTNQHFFHDYLARSEWYRDLTRPPLP